MLEDIIMEALSAPIRAEVIPGLLDLLLSFLPTQEESAQHSFAQQLAETFLQHMEHVSSSSLQGGLQ